MISHHLRRMAVGAAAFAASFASLASESAPGAATAGYEAPFAPMTPALAAQLSENPARPVIVVMRNKLRGADAARDQAPVLDEFTRVHARHTRSFSMANAVAATVSDGEIERLRANPAIEAVIPDFVVRRPAELLQRPAAVTPAAPAGQGNAPTPHVIPGACLPNGKVQLEPEALSVTHTHSDDPRVPTARSLGITGAGVKVAWIAEGIDTHNINFIRPDGRSVFDPAVGGDYQDFSGDGPNAPTAGGEAFLDANAIAGQGLHVYDINGYSAQSLPGPCNIRIEGVAPGASLVGLKIYSTEHYFSFSGVLQALEYAVQVDHVDVLNESYAVVSFPDLTALNLVKQFNDAAVAAGVVVVVASNDAGVTNTISSPATDPEVISTGATTTFREYAQTNYGLARDFATSGWLNDNISALSSSGFDQTGQTITLVAPGDSGWGSCSTNLAMYSDCVNDLGKSTSFWDTGGTSLSSPLTAGGAALVIEAYRKTHKGASPTPALVKQILASTAIDLGVPADEQGSGLLNTYKAVQMAESIGTGAGAPWPVGQTLLFSTNQLNAIGAVGASHEWEVSVTNTGSEGQLVFARGRTFGATENVQRGKVMLADATSLKVINYAGVQNNYSIIKFHVPSNADRLNAAIAYPSKGSATNFNERVRLTLIDPQGRLAAHSLPQGNGNFGKVDVRDPLPGTWTGVIFGDTLAAGGTNGPVPWEVSTQRFESFGTVYPKVFFVPPGGSQRLLVKATGPATPGDASGSIVLTSSGTGYDADVGIEGNSIPVTMRSLVTSGGAQSGTFSGNLTGGNGRDLDPYTGQVQYYQFEVPNNARDITANVSLTNDPTDPVLAYLVSPYGDTLGFARNQDPVTGAYSLALTANSLDPLPGLWTLIVNFAGPVVGNEISQPYHGSIRFNGVQASAATLPNDRHWTLTAGKAVVVPVTITNRGAQALNVFLDPRLEGSQTITLTDPYTGSAADNYALPAETEPSWLVPTQTSSVAIAQKSSLPAMFDFGPYPGDPDLHSINAAGKSQCGTHEVGSYASPSGTVTSGLWYALASECGPYTGAAPAGTATDSAVAHTKPFDANMTSPTGDLWLQAIDPASPLQPVTVNPGQTITINATLTPQGAPGTLVRGVLYIDSVVSTPVEFGGNELAGIPYEYIIE